MSDDEKAANEHQGPRARLMGRVSLEVRAEPEPDDWCVTHVVRGARYCMPQDEAEAVGRALIAAAAEARKCEAAERQLPLPERVRLYLSRLCYMPPHRIADDLGEPEEAIRAALASLAADGKARCMEPKFPHLWEAVDRAGARPEGADDA